MAESSPATNSDSNHLPWYREMNGYHWFVLIVAALGWLFDCLDQQLFILARQPAMEDLLPNTPSQAKIDEFGGYATSIFLLGWGLGGLIFGVLGDRIGRAKTMMITILVYSAFTGLSALSTSFWDFVVYRFLTGMGVGGEFAVGVALVAEVMPDRVRPYALSVLQALSAVGNVSAAVIGMSMGELAERGLVDSTWRPMFIIGAVPALLALVIRWKLKEPERWQRATHAGDVARKLGSYRELFQNPTWRRHAFIGLGLAFAGIVGLWGIAFFTFDLVGNVLTKHFVADVIDNKDDQELQSALNSIYSDDEAKEIVSYEPLLLAETLDDKERELAATEDKDRQTVLQRVFSEQELKAVNADVSFWKGMASMMMNLGAALGMYGFAVLSQRLGRIPTFAICFIAALVTTASVFYFLNAFHQVFWMIPIMGFCILSLFAGYAIYFPELFPTHLRSTGTSFCYNVGRLVAAMGPALLGWLTGTVYAHTDSPLRFAGLTMCGIFVIGLLVLPFAPETKGRPLPE